MVLGNTYERVIWASRRIVTHRWRNADLKGLGSEPHCTPNTWAASSPPLACALLPPSISSHSVLQMLSRFLPVHVSCRLCIWRSSRWKSASLCFLIHRLKWSNNFFSSSPLLSPLLLRSPSLFLPSSSGAWYTSSKLCLLNYSSSLQTPHF